MKTYLKPALNQSDLLHLIPQKLNFKKFLQAFKNFPNKLVIFKAKLPVHIPTSKCKYFPKHYKTF